MSQIYCRGLPVATAGGKSQGEPAEKTTHVRISITTRDNLLEYKKKHMPKCRYGYTSMSDIVDHVLDSVLECKE